MDNLTSEQRKKNMRSIRYKDTKMEVAVRSVLHKKGYRFRKNVSKLIGKPDIVFSKKRVAVFLDSCFWHLCPYHHNIPQTNTKYWLPKLERNKKRAKEVNVQLRKNGWTVLRFWEHQVRKDFDRVIINILKVLG
jgi:DNA mismatch endonuclease (patch repair protein)